MHYQSIFFIIGIILIFLIILCISQIDYIIYITCELNEKFKNITNYNPETVTYPYHTRLPNPIKCTV